MPRIVLAEKTPFSLHALQGYGTIVYIADYINPLRVDETVEQIVAFLEKDFNPEEDFICLTGKVITVSLLLSAAVYKFHSVKALIFDAGASNYKERLIDVRGCRISKEAV